MTSIIKRVTSVAAFAAVTVIAIPALAHAAPAATVSIVTGINSAKVTITSPTHDTATNCVGPWVYSERVAKLIEQSPTLDIANHPENWLKGDPVSPINGNTGGGRAYVGVASGETKTAFIDFIEDGNYVAGTLCLVYPVGPGDPGSYTLTQTKFKIGNAKPNPSGTGSLGLPNFGS